MKRIASILGILAIGVAAVIVPRAAFANTIPIPTITFSEHANNQCGACESTIHITTLDPFPIVVDGFGEFFGVFQNNTGSTLTDFHFSIVYDFEQVNPIQGNGGPFFNLITTEGNNVIWFDQGTGSGIPDFTFFDIFAVYFEPNTVITAEPTAVPEPSTLLLLGFGLAGLVGVGRKRKRA